MQLKIAYWIQLGTNIVGNMQGFTSWRHALSDTSHPKYRKLAPNQTNNYYKWNILERLRHLLYLSFVLFTIANLFLFHRWFWSWHGRGWTCISMFTSRRTWTRAASAFTTRGTRSTSMSVLFSVTSRHVFVAIKRNKSTNLKCFHPSCRSTSLPLVPNLPSFLWAHCNSAVNLTKVCPCSTNLVFRAYVMPVQRYY